jgi:hypothetical protein
MMDIGTSTRKRNGTRANRLTVKSSAWNDGRQARP